MRFPGPVALDSTVMMKDKSPSPMSSQIKQPPAPALPVAATPPMQAQPVVTATPVPAVTGGDAAAHVKAGDAALKAKNLANAEQEYKAAIAIDTASADANFGLGNVYAQGGRLNEA